MQRLVLPFRRNHSTRSRAITADCAAYRNCVRSESKPSMDNLHRVPRWSSCRAKRCAVWSWQRRRAISNRSSQNLSASGVDAQCLTPSPPRNKSKPSTLAHARWSMGRTSRISDRANHPRLYEQENLNPKANPRFAASGLLCAGVNTTATVDSDKPCAGHCGLLQRHTVESGGSQTNKG